MVAFVPPTEETDLKKVIMSLQQVAAGRSNAAGTVTLATGSATTVVTPKQKGTIAPGSTPIFTANTAAAAAELASGNMFVSSVGLDTFTITHTNSATAGRTFLYSISG